MLSHQEKTYESSSVTLIICEPSFLWFSLFYTLNSWLSKLNTIYLSPSARCNSSFLFIKDLFVVYINCYSMSSLLIINLEERQTNVTQRIFWSRHLWVIFFCSSSQKHWQNVDRSSKWTAQLYSAHNLPLVANVEKVFYCCFHVQLISHFASTHFHTEISSFRYISLSGHNISLSHAQIGLSLN